MRLPPVVAVKAHAHTVPSRTTNAELQNSLWMPASLVANSVTGHTHVEVSEGLGLG